MKFFVQRAAWRADMTREAASELRFHATRSFFAPTGFVTRRYDL
jgi:hypothetical protein